MTLSVNDATPSQGQNVTFTITLTNHGPDTAGGVAVTDLLPSTFLFVSATASEGSYNATTGVWSVGTVTTATPQTLTILAVPQDAGPIANTASITSSDEPDPNLANNTATVALSVSPAAITPGQLTLTKTASTTTPPLGGQVTFTVTLTNVGTSEAVANAVSDTLPSGFTIVGTPTISIVTSGNINACGPTNPAPSSYDSATGVWSISSLRGNPCRDVATLTITVTSSQCGSATNTATLTVADGAPPPAPVPTDSVTVETGLGSAECTPVDLGVTKTVDNSTPNVGDNVTFTVQLTNHDAATSATGVQVTDLLPAGLTFVSANPEQGTYDPATGVWDVGSEPAGTTLTLTVTATVTAAAVPSVTNSATITAAAQPDPNPGNNSSSTTVTPQQADLAITKSVTPVNPPLNGTVTFTVTLTNNGPDGATGIEVTDLLPAQLAFVSATPSQGSYVSTTGLWTVGAVADGGTATLTITATVTATGEKINTATITAADQFDPDTGNNTASVAVNPGAADLAIAKTVNDATPNVGDVVTFTITLTNNGPSTATRVQVTDLLPAGLTLVSDSASSGTYTASTGLWNVGPPVPDGGTRTLTLMARVVASGTITNTASITQADQTDPDLTNNSASQTLTVEPAADLAVTKSVNDETPNVGGRVTFTIQVTNNGPDDATGVTVTDPLPTGLTFVSDTTTQGSYTSGTGVWTVGALAVGSTATLTINAIVVAPGPITNVATAAGDQVDPDETNNSVSATVTPQQADLALAKTVNDPTPNVGDTVTFTVTLTNNGPDTATGVAVEDLLPAGLTFVSATPSVGTYNSPTGVWTVGTVAVGAPQTLLITALVVSPGAETNTASISHADQFDPNPGNNSASVTVTPLQADLALAKTVSNPTPNVGDTVTFTVTLTNNGPDSATGVTVTDAFPSGLTFVSAAPSEGSYDPATGIWTVGTVTVGIQTLQIQATVVSPSPQTNTATISHSDRFDPNPGNNTASVTLTPQQADLALSKTVSNPTPNVGDTVTFTVTLTNLGPDTATGVMVQDLLPAGLTFVSATPSEGTYNSATGVWAVGTVTDGGIETLLITALVVSPSPQTNTATISHADQFDPNPANNTASVTLTPQQADLALTKSVNDPTPNVGDIVTFTLTLINDGPDPATNVQVTDLLAAGLSFVSFTATEGSYSPASGVWTVGTVTNGGTQTLQVQARVDSPSPQTNTATISHADQFDPNTANNTATATVTPQLADLALTKTVDDPTPNVGDIVTFTVTLTNLGPDTATGVTVEDLLPAGLTFISATPSQGTYNSTSGVWTVGTVTTATPQTLLITAVVVSPNQETNTATISHADQFDPNPGNNTATATVTPQQADLALTKTVDNPTPNVGGTVTFTVTLTNLGPDPATSVTVEDLLPAGLTFVSDTASQGTYDPVTGVWSVGTVTTTTAQTLLITVTVPTPESQTNTAAILHSDQFDPDLSNNSASATVSSQQADLALAKTVDDPIPNVGDDVTFTVTLTNRGPDDATGVEVTDLLPAGLTFVSASPSEGTYDEATGLWTVGTVTTTTTETLTITATVVSADPSTNTATITRADQHDPDPSNDTASATVTPQQADLAVTKTVDDPTPNVGQEITFTVKMSNLGPDPATGVSLGDTLPAGLHFVSATATQGGYDPATGIWALGTLAVGPVQTLTITALVASPEPQTNTATIILPPQFDPDLSNNSASVTVTPQQADLAIAKTVSNPTPQDGDTITYTVSVTNHGPDTATGVAVEDDLPAGLSFVSATAGSGSYNAGTGVWSIGTVSSGQTVTLQIVARVTGTGVVTNAATIGHADQFDPDLANNRATASITASAAPGKPAPGPGATPSPPAAAEPGLPSTGAPPSGAP